jgi:HSP20 family protein
VHAKAKATRGDKSESDGEQVCWSEFRSNEAYRRVELPAEVKVDKVSAKYENGLLKVLAPKRMQPAKAVAITAAV